jgi:malto-oligosyltrehalose synthase
MTEHRLLGSTYRLQLNAIGFSAAADLVPFLNDLGVQTCYVSPISQARRGSTHGYDAIDPVRLDPSLGSRADYDRLLDRLADHGMTLLVDVVPNHMAASTENPYFADVLTHGRQSRFAAYFDVAWDEQDGKILLPVLGRPLPDVVAAGELTVVRDETGAPALGYFDHRFPLAPQTVEAAADGADLDDLLGRQHYRLADWRVANRELNYRRFFDINELIGVRQEDPEVFRATHQLIRELAADPRVAGVRVDHVDGLRDPAGYLVDLRDALADTASSPVIEVEKILDLGERLPDWPVAGTTGYEFAVAVTGLFVDAAGARQLTAADAHDTEDARSFRERAVDAKRQVIATLFEHQRDQVVAKVRRALGERPDGSAGRSAADLTAAVAELTAQLSVYRTYRRPGHPITVDDLRRIESAAELARPTLAPGQAAALDETVGLLCGDLEPATPAAEAVEAWQQLTSPATAKGVEDTALYTPGCPLAAADVGGHPGQGAESVEDFHAFLADRRGQTPLAMSALSTHDSKRSHDVRCRLAVLTEIARDWESTVQALEDHDEASARDVPDAAERRYLYESLAGVWPLDGDVGEGFVERIDQHVLKAAREAKRHTSWTSPDPGYEAALREFARGLLTDADPSRRDLVARASSDIEYAGATNSLASVAIRAAAPGVPDVYQGDDLWFLALVDPDNRRPFDAAAHAAALRGLPEVGPDSDVLSEVGDLLSSWRDGRVKQHVVRESLRLRRRMRAVLEVASYQPLQVQGSRRDHVVAFARIAGDDAVVCVVPRLTQALVGPGRFPVGQGCWGDTVVRLPELGAARWRDAVTGATVPAPDAAVGVGVLLRTLPIALVSTR